MEFAMKVVLGLTSRTVASMAGLLAAGLRESARGRHVPVTASEETEPGGPRQ